MPRPGLDLDVGMHISMAHLRNSMGHELRDGLTPRHVARYAGQERTWHTQGLPIDTCSRLLRDACSRLLRDTCSRLLKRRMQHAT